MASKPPPRHAKMRGNGAEWRKRASERLLGQKRNAANTPLPCKPEPEVMTSATELMFVTSRGIVKCWLLYPQMALSGFSSPKLKLIDQFALPQRRVPLKRTLTTKAFPRFCPQQPREEALCRQQEIGGTKIATGDTSGWCQGVAF